MIPRRILAGFLSFVLAFAWVTPVQALRPAAVPQSAGLESLEDRLREGSVEGGVSATAGLEGLGRHIEGWDGFSAEDRRAVLGDLKRIQDRLEPGVTIRSLIDHVQGKTRISPNPNTLSPDVLNGLPQEAFSSPPSHPLLSKGLDWFFEVPQAERRALRDLLNQTVILLGSGGGGKRFKGGSAEHASYLIDLKLSGRFEKPTAIVHVSRKSPEVRSLESIDRVARLLGAKPKVVIVDSPETEQSVTTDLKDNARWINRKGSRILLERRNTIVYPSFDEATKKIVTYQGAVGRRHHVLAAANGTFGALQGAWSAWALPDHRYLIVYGDDPALATPSFLISLLRRTLKIREEFGREPDFLAVATTKRAQQNPRGGTLVDVAYGGKTWHLLLQPPERTDALNAVESEPYFPFDTGVYYLSGRFMETAIERSVPLRHSSREAQPPGTEELVPVFLPEKYLTSIIDLVNDDGLRFSYHVAQIPLDDGRHLSTYRAMKQYDDAAFGIQGVANAAQTLARRDRQILRRLFKSQGAGRRLTLGRNVAVEISPRVLDIRVGPQGQLRVSGRVGVEFAFDGIRVRRRLTDYSPGNPRFSEDFVKVLGARNGVISIDREITVTDAAVQGLGDWSQPLRKRLESFPAAGVIIADLGRTAARDASDSVDPSLIELIRQWLEAKPDAEFIFLSTRGVGDIDGRIGGLKDHPRVTRYGQSGGSDPSIRKWIKGQQRSPLTSEEMITALERAAELSDAWPGAKEVLAAKGRIVPATLAFTFSGDSKTASQRALWEQWKRKAAAGDLFLWVWPDDNPHHVAYQYGPLSVLVPKKPGSATIAMLSYGSAKHTGLLDARQVQGGRKQLARVLQAIQGEGFLRGSEVNQAGGGTGTTINLALLNKAEFLVQRILERKEYAGKTIFFLDDEGGAGSSGYRALLLGSDPKYSNLFTIAVDPVQADSALIQAAHAANSRVIVVPQADPQTSESERQGPAVVKQVLRTEISKLPAAGLEEDSWRILTQRPTEKEEFLIDTSTTWAQAHYSKGQGLARVDTAYLAAIVAAQEYASRPEVQEALETAAGVLDLPAEVARELSGDPRAIGALLIGPQASVQTARPGIYVMESDLENAGLESVAAVVKPGPDAEAIFQSLREIAARAGDLLVFEMGEGIALDPDRIPDQVALHLGGVSALPRSAGGGKAEIRATPVVVFERLRTAPEGEYPDVVFIGIAFQFKDDYGRAHSLIVFTQV